ncbi:bifunctional oligoribonuclease/PAP phosphatase NrnA [bacterium C-53]|nr:bifunctional oligoribonuclease/PAP phosphatase NrnA [Lachnospiraceae bacterium]NBI04094.1 bifunctional oligoribonuclease/PAP phosphatase NrnA [Lachnospiraceae bacterium]RKJ08717.1 bifunctional oligoribonuclease/PAP phosphatase NrnA [bacterium C-53]
MNLLTICKDAKRIGIAGHLRPDGDCVGASLALYGFLKKVYPMAQVDLFLEKPSEVFSYLKGYDEIRSDYGKEEEYDVFIALDSSDTERLGEALMYFNCAKETVCIDHHISNKGFGTHRFLVPTASATSEIVYDIIDKEYMDVEIAKAVYTGIIHDTGVFQYSNTTKRTFEIAGDLISYGFDFSKIIDETFYQKTYIQNQILGRAVLESILFMGGRCIVSAVDQKMMKFYHVTPKDLDGIINQLRITKGVDCAIFLYETGVLEYKVSMRSNDLVDVAAIAAVFGGGGHKKAAGCTMNGTFHDVINNISGYIESQLNEQEKEV